MSRACWSGVNSERGVARLPPRVRRVSSSRPPVRDPVSHFWMVRIHTPTIAAVSLFINSGSAIGINTARGARFLLWKRRIDLRCIRHARLDVFGGEGGVLVQDGFRRQAFG